MAIAAVLLALLGSGARPLGEAAIGLVAFLALTLAVARLLPVVLRALRTEHDLFLMVSVASGLALAGVGSAVFGVPLALAAFVGGLAVSESPEAAEARRRLLPFRDLFAVLFFVAIGTLIQPDALFRGIGWLALFLVLIVVAKVAVVYGLARAARLPARPLQLAIGLGQIGEFSFVLGSAAVAADAITNEAYVALVAAVALSIASARSSSAWSGSANRGREAPPPEGRNRRRLVISGSTIRNLLDNVIVKVLASPCSPELAGRDAIAPFARRYTR